jgi:hypothetical protein
MGTISRRLLTGIAALDLMLIFAGVSNADDRNDCMGKNRDVLNHAQISAACGRMIARGPSSAPNLLVFGLAVATQASIYVVDKKFS